MYINILDNLKLESHICSLFAQFTWKVDQQWNYVKLGVGSNITPYHFFSTEKVIFGHYVYQFMWKADKKWNQVYMNFKLSS